MTGEPSKRRQIFAWCLFDFANSSFTTVVITVIFSFYFIRVLAGEDARLWNAGLFVSNFAIILTAPIIGAIADHSSSKKRFLFASYLICVVATSALFFSNWGRLTWRPARLKSPSST